MNDPHRADDTVRQGVERLSMQVPGPNPRDSTYESAHDAAGIFSLYGDPRDSLLGRPASQGPSTAPTTPMIPQDSAGEAIEELHEPPVSPGLWEGPMSALQRSSVELGASKRDSSISVAPPIHVSEHTDRLSHNGGTHGSNVMAVNGEGQEEHRSSVLSNSTSSTTPPVHRDIARLSPAKPRVSNGSSLTNGSGSASASSSAVPSRSPSQSQVSFAGSSQYPGEEADAFHIRSTYARLESEGVHGDGWDAGVERTRGGPSVGKRATIFPFQKAGDVGSKEREFLSSLDRYGFVNEPLRNRSETRVALLPTAPLRRIPRLPSTSPLAGKTASRPIATNPILPSSGPPPRTPDVPKAIPGDDERHRRKETERVSKWMQMMSVKRREGGNAVSWAWRSDAQAKLLKRVYKGVPDRWRMAAWWTLSEDACSRYKGKQRSADELKEEYLSRIDLPSVHDVQIDLDVPRTISGHTLFVTRYGQGQRSLFHVLHCFSLLCDTCGYCQGMGPIAATLLCYFEPERTYALLVRLHDHYGMHDVFAPGFPGLLEAFYVQERLMEYIMPEVYESFRRNFISSSAWGTKWYITLFVNTVPFSQQLRLWDALWIDGRDITVLTSVAILWAYRDLLAAPNANFESILSLLSSYFVAEDDDALLRWIRKMYHQPGLKGRMDAWREEWHVLVRDGKSESALL